MKKIVILFHSNNYAIWAKKVFERSGVSVALISVPRHLSSECGYCIETELQYQQRCTDILHDQSIEYDRIEMIE